MAAGTIYQTVTTTSGETVELAFYVDDTVTPTTWIPVRINGNTAGAPAAFGAGAVGTTVPRVTLCSDTPSPVGLAQGSTTSGQTGSMIMGAVTTGAPSYTTAQTSPASLDLAGNLRVANVPLTNIGAGEYETVAASQTAQVLGPTGATGDYITGLLVVPATVNPGNVLLLDNATSITVFTGGTASVSNLVPFLIPLGMISVSGAWKVTTGANVSVIGIGNFT